MDVYYDADGAEIYGYELESVYGDLLDEVYGVVVIAGIEYDTSAALRDVDPTAFRCGFLDWLDSEIRDGVYFEESPQAA